MRNWLLESVILFVLLGGAFAVILWEGRNSRAIRTQGGFVLCPGWFMRGLVLTGTLAVVGLCIAMWLMEDVAWSARLAWTGLAVAFSTPCFALFRRRVAYGPEGIVFPRLFGLGPKCSIAWEEVESLDDDGVDFIILTRSGKQWKFPLALRGHRDFLAYAEQRLARGKEHAGQAGDMP